MIWMLLLGIVIGALGGAVLMACCAIHRKDDEYAED
jgi:hypothetical protein